MTRQVMPAAVVVLGALPTNIDLVLYQGDDFRMNITLDDSVNPIDLTGYVAKAEIRAAPGGDTVLASFDASVTGPTTVALHLTSAESAKLDKNAAWDVQVTDPASAVATLAYGTVQLHKDVTR